MLEFLFNKAQAFGTYARLIFYTRTLRFYFSLIKKTLNFLCYF